LLEGPKYNGVDVYALLRLFFVKRENLLLLRLGHSGAVLQCVAVSCSVMQCGAVLRQCCTVLQCVTMHCSDNNNDSL